MSLSQSLYGEKKDVMYLTADATSLADLKVQFINNQLNKKKTWIAKVSDIYHANYYVGGGDGRRVKKWKIDI